MDRVLTRSRTENDLLTVPLHSVLLKNPKGGPFYVKKIFVSDFHRVENLKSLWSKDLADIPNDLSKGETIF